MGLCGIFASNKSTFEGRSLPLKSLQPHIVFIEDSGNLLLRWNFTWPKEVVLICSCYQEREQVVISRPLLFMRTVQAFLRLSLSSFVATFKIPLYFVNEANNEACLAGNQVGKFSRVSFSKLPEHPGINVWRYIASYGSTGKYFYMALAWTIPEWKRLQLTEQKDRTDSADRTFEWAIFVSLP